MADAHGDITTLTDDTGSVSSRQEYDPWGGQSSGPAQEMGYLGAYARRSDIDLGVMQMGVRSYDPTLGQFLSEDPLLGEPGREQAWDRYPYVWDNPLDLYDLDGRISVGDVVDGVGNAGSAISGGLNDCFPNYWACGKHATYEGLSEAGDWGLNAGEDTGDWGLNAGEDTGNFVADRAHNAYKYLQDNMNFSTGEAIGDAATVAAGYGICVVAGPEAVAVCAAADVLGAAAVGTDIADDDNSLWPNSYF